jgi:hypothetical protein
MFGGLFFFFFFEFLTPSTLGCCNFLNSNRFLIIFNAPHAPMEGVQVLLGTPKIIKPSPWIQPALRAFNVWSLDGLPYMNIPLNGFRLLQASGF